MCCRAWATFARTLPARGGQSRARGRDEADEGARRMESQAYHDIHRIENELWWYRGRRMVCRGLLRRALGAAPDRRVLDVGCGTGFNFGMLSEFGAVEGVEPSEEGMAYCRSRGLTGVVQAEAHALPYPDATFDLVTALDVIEHLDDDVAALREFQRVLKPGGHLLLYVPALPVLFGRHDRIVHHRRRYMLGGLQRVVAAGGFQLLHASYVNLLVLPLVVLARLALALVPHRPHVEMGLPPGPVNRLLTRFCKWEVPWVLGRGLPLGMSLVALARKD